MEFISNESEVEDDRYKLIFSDGEEEDEQTLSASIEDQMFIDNDEGDCQQKSRNFHREFNNREIYVHFHNQARNPVEVMQEQTENYFGEDDMPELYDPEERDDVEFDFFETDKALAKKL